MLFDINVTSMLFPPGGVPPGSGGSDEGDLEEGLIIKSFSSNVVPCGTARYTSGPVGLLEECKFETLTSESGRKGNC